MADRRNGCTKFDNTVIRTEGDYTYYKCGCRLCEDISDVPGCRWHEIDYYCNNCKYKDKKEVKNNG